MSLVHGMQRPPPPSSLPPSLPRTCRYVARDFVEKYPERSPVVLSHTSVLVSVVDLSTLFGTLTYSSLFSVLSHTSLPQYSFCTGYAANYVCGPIACRLQTVVTRQFRQGQGLGHVSMISSEVPESDTVRKLRGTSRLSPLPLPALPPRGRGCCPVLA